MLWKKRKEGRSWEGAKVGRWWPDKVTFEQNYSHAEISGSRKCKAKAQGENFTNSKAIEPLYDQDDFTAGGINAP